MLLGLSWGALLLPAKRCTSPRALPNTGLWPPGLLAGSGCSQTLGVFPGAGVPGQGLPAPVGAVGTRLAEVSGAGLGPGALFTARSVGFALLEWTVPSQAVEHAREPFWGAESGKVRGQSLFCGV